MFMNLKAENRNGSVFLHIDAKRMDAHNAEDVKTRLLGLIEADGVDLVVDLRDVHFIDSSGLGVLLSAYKKAKLKNGRLTLTGLQPQVQSTFDMTRLNRVFDIKSGLEGSEMEKP